MNEPMKAYEGLFKLRQWSAHGSRYEAPTTFAGGPLDAFGVVSDLVIRLRREIADFPLEG